MTRRVHGRTINAAERDHQHGLISASGFRAIIEGEATLTEARERFPEFRVGEVIVEKYPRYDANPRDALIIVTEVVQFNLRSDVKVRGTDRFGREVEVDHYMVVHFDDLYVDQQAMLRDEIEEIIEGAGLVPGYVAVNRNHSMAVSIFGGEVIMNVNKGGPRQFPGDSTTYIMAAEIMVAATVEDIARPVNPYEVRPADPIRFKVQNPETLPEQLREDDTDLLAGDGLDPEEPEFGESREAFVSRMVQERNLTPEEAGNAWDYYVRPRRGEEIAAEIDRDYWENHPPFEVGDLVSWVDRELRGEEVYVVRGVRPRRTIDPGSSPWFVQIEGSISQYGSDMFVRHVPPLTDAEFEEDERMRNKVDQRGDI